ncbi:hypothetical protein G7Y79_00001g000190 [Physcia stellaris]|nr:hypothetical protein G7Y79_00001g000190 [Physcia stellaris]
MHPLPHRLLTPWLRLLSLPTQPAQSWHLSRLHDELHEYRHATTPLSKLSESSDIHFALHRAAFDGCPLHLTESELPPASALMYSYMIAKYTLRWGFYRVVGGCCKGRRDVREVVNPAKERKLDVVAGRHGIDKEEFRRVAGRLRLIYFQAQAEAT